MFAPRSFADVTEIADALRSRQVVIVNVQGADRNLLQRVVDFTSGVAYTIDGRIQKLAEAIYLVVPAGVNVNSAGVREQLDNDGMLGLQGHPVVAKITIIDIQHKEFKKSLQGFDRNEVNEFLDEIIETLEDEAQTRAALEGEIADLRERISHFKAMEESLQSTLLLAQRTADEVKAAAHKEADLIKQEARLAAEREISALERPHRRVAAGRAAPQRYGREGEERAALAAHVAPRAARAPAVGRGGVVRRIDVRVRRTGPPTVKADTEPVDQLPLGNGAPAHQIVE